ncbi:molecular chaperone TorD family protein [bacterium]|nr:molecular chaperone TorD family protein [bacterium]
MTFYQPDKIMTIEFYRVILEFFSLVFQDLPEETTVDQLVQGNPFEDWPVDSDTAALKDGLDLLEAFCGQWSPKQLQLIRDDYTKLFLNHDKILAPPYESLFLSDDHSLYKEQILKVRAAYKQYGLQVPQKNQISDDHLCFELQFLATICDQLVNTWRENNQPAIDSLLRDALTFLEMHLLKWLPEFVERVVKYADTDFYRGVAMVTGASVKDLHSYLKYIQ